MLKLIRLTIFAWLVIANTHKAVADDSKQLNYRRILLTSNDSVKCVKLIDYAGRMSDSLLDYNFALLIFEKVSVILKEKNYPSLNPNLYFNWACTLYSKGDYESADKLYVKALSFKILDKIPKLKAKILNAAGANVQQLTAYKRGLVYYQEALELYVQLNDVKGKGRVYQNMANIFALAGDFTKSDLFFDKAAEIFKNNDMLEKYCIVLGNKAYVKWKLGMPDSAKIFIIRSLNFKFKECGSTWARVDRYLNLGLIYADLKQWDSCFFEINRGKKIADSCGISETIIGTYYYDLGFCYNLKGDLTKAADYYKQALHNKTGISDYRMLYNNLVEIYVKKKQYDSAFSYKSKGMALADSIYKSELKEHIDFENKRAEILEKDYQNQVQSALQQKLFQQLEKRNYLLFGIIIVLITLALLFSLYFRHYWLKVKKEHLQSELDFLKAQLNPHFLFNSINNIYVLLDENKNRAAEVLLKFSELMRYQLYECNEATIPLAKELKFLENYMEFEKLRYSNKISVQYHPAPADLFNQLLIAPLLLQPFIENAFKHTPKHKNQPGNIDIHISITGNEFLLEISNTRSLGEVSALPGGIGLGNVKKRLKLLYANKHDLKISSENDLYTIILKLKLAND